MSPTRKKPARVRAGGVAGAPAARAPAELVFLGAAVYTVDPARSWARAVAIRGGRIAYVGEEAGARSWIGSATRVLDLRGRMILPGFHDSHVHPIAGGLELAECDLNGASSEADVLAAVGRYAAEHPETAWIRGGGWQLPLFRQGNPHRRLLDAVVPTRPVFLSSADEHSAWVNSRALALAAIGRETPDPLRGRIERDEEGEPTGTLRESAMELIERLLPEYTPTDYQTGLRRGLALANRYGIVALYDADGDERRLAAYAALADRGELTARVVTALRLDPTVGAAQVPRLEGLRERYRGPRLRAIGVKIYLDGVIESSTAALLDPYLDSPGNRGSINLEGAELDAVVAALDRAGFQIHVHAIGDRAVREALDAFSRAREQDSTGDRRRIIAHLELVNPTDVPRFRALGVIADFQPLWAFADRYIREFTEPRLGPVRSRWLYPIGSLARSGAVVAAGSDWSVSSLNPLEGIQVAITRRGPHDGLGPAWIPEERIDLASIIAAYTINGAYAMHQERETGSIEVGKAADLVVLDQNLFEVPPEQIHTVKVVRTYLEGREVYGTDPRT